MGDASLQSLKPASPPKKEVSLPENKVVVMLYYIHDGSQFYLIDACIDEQEYWVLARYKEINQFRKTSHLPHLESSFPGKSIFGSSTGDKKKTEERRRLLQVWLNEVVLKAPAKLHAFLTAQQKKYGNVTSILAGKNDNNNNNNNNNNNPENGENSQNAGGSLTRFEFSSKPWLFEDNLRDPLPLYWVESDVQVYIIERRRWRVVSKGNLLYRPRANCYCHFGCINPCSADGAFNFIYYPWNMAIRLAKDNVPPVYIANEHTQILPDGHMVWVHVPHNVLTYNIMTNSWRTIPIKNSYAPDYLMADAVAEIHIISRHSHFAIDKTTLSVRTLPPPPSVPDEGKLIGVRARELIVACFGTMILIFDLISEKWKKEPYNIPSDIISIVWDKCHCVYAWTVDIAFCFDLRKKDWEIREELFVSQNGAAFCTSDFDAGKMIDEHFENTLLINDILADPNPWDDLYAQDKVSLKTSKLLAAFDNVKGFNFQNKVEEFNKDKEAFVEAFREAVEVVAKRILFWILLLLRGDPNLATDLAEFMKHFTVRKRAGGSTLYCLTSFGFFYPHASNFSNSNTSSRAISISPSSSSSSQPSPSSETTTTSITTTETKENEENAEQIELANSTADLIDRFEYIRAALANQKLPEHELQRRQSIISRLEENKIQVPEVMLCPITKHVMFDPVFTCDGHTFERLAILEWFSLGHHTSPLTNQPLKSFKVVSNHFAKKIITQFLSEHNLLE